MSRIKNDTADSSGMEVRGMVKVTSLGCAKNFVDTEVASASFLCEGFGLTSSDTDADIQFINTCAFLEDAPERGGENDSRSPPLERSFA